MADGWGGITVNSVASNGDLLQLYPPWATAGVTKSSSTLGQNLRNPGDGELCGFTIRPDGSHSGYIELWDVNGADAGADVSGATAITNTQLAALQTRGLARLITRQDFASTIGSGPVRDTGVPYKIQRGLAARAVLGGGSCEISLKASGCFYLTTSQG